MVKLRGVLRLANIELPEANRLLPGPLPEHTRICIAWPPVSSSPRGRGDAGNASKFFVTIAAQLAQQSPMLRQGIYEALNANVSIVRQGLHDQWKQLVIQPLAQLEAGALQQPLLLVIDALDECDSDNDIELIVRAARARPRNHGRAAARPPHKPARAACLQWLRSRCARGAPRRCAARHFGARRRARPRCFSATPAARGAAAVLPTGHVAWQ